MHPKKPPQFSKYVLRTCQTMHECWFCDHLIGPGDKYRDGGYGRRAHENCAIESDNEWYNFKERK